MIAVKGLFDGKRIRLLESVDIKEPQEVIVTFLGTSKDDSLYREIYNLVESGGAFDFLNAPEEDVYCDDDLKVKYR